MKKLFIIISCIAIIAGCTSAQQKTGDAAAVDSQAKQAVIDSVNAANQKQKTIDSLNAVIAAKSNSSVSHNQSPSLHTTETQQAATATAPVATAPVETTPATTTTTTTQQRGMSNTAKDALIGTGVGAITGALVSKHHHKVGGAVIGGLIGAGAGAGTGAIVDQSKKKKAEQEQQQQPPQQ